MVQLEFLDRWQPGGFPKRVTLFWGGVPLRDSTLNRVPLFWETPTFESGQDRCCQRRLPVAGLRSGNRTT